MRRVAHQIADEIYKRADRGPRRVRHQGRLRHRGSARPTAARAMRSPSRTSTATTNTSSSIRHGPSCRRPGRRTEASSHTSRSNPVAPASSFRTSPPASASRSRPFRASTAPRRSPPTGIHLAMTHCRRTAIPRSTSWISRDETSAPNHAERRDRYRARLVAGREVPGVHVRPRRQAADLQNRDCPEGARSASPSKAATTPARCTRRTAPDSRSCTARTADTASGSSIWRISALQVLTDSELDESPSFAPNGRVILYATTDGADSVLAAVSPDGRMHQRLAGSDRRCPRTCLVSVQELMPGLEAGSMHSTPSVRSERFASGSELTDRRGMRLRLEHLSGEQGMELRPFRLALVLAGAAVLAACTGTTGTVEDDARGPTRRPRSSGATTSGAGDDAISSTGGAVADTTGTGPADAAARRADSRDIRSTIPRGSLATRTIYFEFDSSEVPEPGRSRPSRRTRAISPSTPAP